MKLKKKKTSWAVAQWNKFYWRVVIFNPSIYLIGPLIIIFNKTPILPSYEITKKDPFIYPGPIESWLCCQSVWILLFCCNNQVVRGAC